MSDTAPLIELAPVADLATCTGIVEGFDQEMMNNQECHATAKAILKAVGGQAEGPRTGWSGLKARLNSDSAGVYRVDLRIPATESMGRWDHSFAVLKVGTSVVIYQSFQGAYTLGQWLARTAGAHTRYAAASGEALAGDRVQEFMLGVEGMLATFKEGKEPTGFWSCFSATPDYDEVAGRFYDAAVNLFGAPASRRRAALNVIIPFMKLGSIEVRWTRAPIAQ